MTPLIPKSDFVGLEAIAHLCSRGEAPWLAVSPQLERGCVPRPRADANGNPPHVDHARRWAARAGALPLDEGPQRKMVRGRRTSTARPTAGAASMPAMWFA